MCSGVASDCLYSPPIDQIIQICLHKNSMVKQTVPNFNNLIVSVAYFGRCPIHLDPRIKKKLFNVLS